LVNTILAIGPEGQGHRPAMAAWQKLSRADAADLPILLSALDNANPLAANWLRSAVESIAARSLNTGLKHSAAAFERLAIDVGHQPRARRLAFDLLLKTDSTAADGLIPGMLDDPCDEFRRDAVARLLTDATKLRSRDVPEDAIQIYLKALSAARDQDQVDAI